MSLSKDEFLEIDRLREERTSQLAERRKAAAAWVMEAVKCGALPPAKSCLCVDCGKQAAVYDHRDYTRPDFVEPVCKSCDVRRGPGEPYEKHPTRKDCWITRKAVPFQKFNDMEIVIDRSTGMSWEDLSKKYGLSVSQLKLVVSSPRTKRHNVDDTDIINVSVTSTGVDKHTRTDRDRSIVSDARRGIRVMRIALDHGITRQRVYQILRQYGVWQ